MQRDLAERARQGDHDAFTALVDGSIGRLYAVACLILRDRDRAHDAVQEALVAAWRDIRGLRDRVVPDEPPVSPSPELTVVDRDRLERGFARLGADQRAVLVLYHYLGLPLTEVAETLDIPSGTAKSRVSRAVAAMRAAIDADDRTDLVEKGRTA
jgi:RNA polymerase sigma-70 factor (ECF subfamily)